MVTGGNGGSGGTGGGGNGQNGTGAVAVIGSGLTLINSGSILAGEAGGSSAPMNAVVFTGGLNVLELRGGSTIVGGVVASSSADTLRLGGPTDGIIDVSQIGNQYVGFGIFEKTGTSTWTLVSSTLAQTPWTLTNGTLSVGGDGSLGSGTLTFDGGTLRYSTGFGSTRDMTIHAPGGVIDTNGNDASLAGTMTGPGGLTKMGAGTLTLSGANAYGGVTTIDAGTLSVMGVNSMSPLALAGGTLAGAGSTGAVSGTTGSVAPGASGPGALTTNGISLGSATSLAVDLDGPAPISGYDQLVVDGPVSLGGAALALTLGSSPVPGEVFDVIENDGSDSVTGTFAGLPEGSVFSSGGFQWLISYQAGDGNDVALTQITPPTAAITGPQTGQTYTRRVCPDDLLLRGGSGRTGYLIVLRLRGSIGRWWDPEHLDAGPLQLLRHRREPGRPERDRHDPVRGPGTRTSARSAFGERHPADTSVRSGSTAGKWHGR
jgi:autotransporter-associated beta strand protein